MPPPRAAFVPTASYSRAIHSRSVGAKGARSGRNNSPSGDWCDHMYRQRRVVVPAEAEAACRGRSTRRPSQVEADAAGSPAEAEAADSQQRPKQTADQLRPKQTAASRTGTESTRASRGRGGCAQGQEAGAAGVSGRAGGGGNGARKFAGCRTRRSDRYSALMLGCFST